MKTLHFASILVLAAATTFACGDDDDDTTPSGSAGTAGSGSAGKGNAGTAGTGTGGKATGGTASTQGGAGPNEGGMGGGGATENPGGADAGGQGGATSGCVPTPIETNGGAGGEGGASNAALELIGTWTSDFSTETIGQTSWHSVGTGFESTSTIVSYDNAANVVYTESDCQFSKNVYLDVQGSTFYYCTVAYNLPTLAAAKADATTADSTDPEHGGCGGSFPWSKLTKQ